MKKSFSILLILSLVFTLSCKKDKKEDNTDIETETEVTTEDTSNDSSDSNTMGDGSKVTVTLEAKSNSTASGNAVFKQTGSTVQLVAVISGLSPGEHAIHIHEKADCSADDATSSGGHWNPTGQPHGKFGDEKGYHKGDIGNLTANDQGRGTITLVTKEWCIGCGDPNKDIIGKALIVHQGTDDFTTQPTGAAGGRVSCGGIIQ